MDQLAEISINVTKWTVNIKLLQSISAKIPHYKFVSQYGCLSNHIDQSETEKKTKFVAQCKHGSSDIPRTRD